MVFCPINIYFSLSGKLILPLALMAVICPPAYAAENPQINITDEWTVHS
jgi:hypothetical protein